MLATCQLNGWDLTTYRDPEHPLQRLMADTLADLAGEPVAATAVDGCGAPVMAVSLVGLARAFGALAGAPEGTDEAKVARAIRENPQWLGGTRRDVTSLINGVPGLVAKDGAEAVYAAGLADGSAVALKIADGGQRARPVVMAAALRRLGVEADVLAELEHAPVLGHGQPVGSVVAVGF
jgi:L-asparaginase II